MAREVFEKLAEVKKNAILKSGMSEFSRKSYSEASTDTITRNCGISKGILFHYFGSKKEFYLYCLEQALERLITEESMPERKDFYDIIFCFMEEKLDACRKFPDEMRIINMAARETNSQVFEHKNKVLAKYIVKGKKKSAMIIAKAVTTLDLKDSNTEKVTAALAIYMGAIINKYLETYKEIPEEFFKQSDKMKEEIREYMDIMLYGVVREEVQ